MTHDTQEVVNIASKSQVPRSYGLGVKVFIRFEGNDDHLNQLITKVFVEQSVKYTQV